MTNLPDWSPFDRSMDPTDDPPLAMVAIREGAARIMFYSRHPARHNALDVWDWLRSQGVNGPDEDPHEVNDRGAAFSRMKRGF